MDDAGPSNWYINPIDANNTDLECSDQSDDYMDVDSVPQFTPNPNDPQSHLANLTGAFYLLTLLEEEERPRRRIHNCSFIGEKRVDYYLDGYPNVIFDKVRMDADTFIGLSSLLEGRRLLHSTHNMSVDAQLFIFLAIVGHDYTIRDSADHW